MSARSSGNVWKYSQHKGSDLLVLLAIADYAKDDGTGAWPSVAGLAEKTRLSERNIQYILRKLEASGELVIEKHAGPRGCHLYHVVLDTEGAKIAPVGGAKIAGAKFAGGATQRQEGVQPSAERGAIAIAPEPLIEPSIEPSVKEGRAKASPPHPIRDDFEVTGEMYEKVRRKHPNLDILAATEKWVTSMKANTHKYQYTNWDQAWYGAMDRAIDWQAERGGSTNGSGPTNNRSAIVERATRARVEATARANEEPDYYPRLGPGADPV